MADTTAMAASARRSSDTEKPPGPPPMAVVDMAEKVDSEGHPSEDAEPSKKADDKAEKEKEGSLRDFAVS